MEFCLCVHRKYVDMCVCVVPVNMKKYSRRTNGWMKWINEWMKMVWKLMRRIFNCNINGQCFRLINSFNIQHNTTYHMRCSLSFTYTWWYALIKITPIYILSLSWGNIYDCGIFTYRGSEKRRRTDDDMRCGVVWWGGANALKTTATDTCDVCVCVFLEFYEIISIQNYYDYCYSYVNLNAVHTFGIGWRCTRG